MADDIPKANPKPIPKPGSLKPAGSGKKDIWKGFCLHQGYI